GCIHGDQNQRRVTPLRVCQPLIYIRSQDGFDFTIKTQFKNEWTSSGMFVGTNRRQPQENHNREQQAKRREGRDQSPFPGRLGLLHWSKPIGHGAPPGFFSAGLEFCKCSSSCLAST